MEDKKLLTNEELEKVSGGSYTLDHKEESAFRSAKFQLEEIIHGQADANYHNNVSHMLSYCGHALDGRISAEAALDYMQDWCNQINIDDRCVLQDILDQLRSSLGR